MKKLNLVHFGADNIQMLPSDDTGSAGVGQSDAARMVWCLAVLVAILLSVTPVPAQVSAEKVIDAPLLDVSDARRAYNQVEAWLADPTDNLMQADPIRVTGLVGVRLTLRSQGIVVGQGEAYREDLAAALGKPGPAIDLVALLAQATDQAKAGVLESLADARLRSVLEGRSMPDPVELTVADVHQRMIVDLELAHGLKSVQVPATAEPDSVYARFAPGYHGLAFTDTAAGSWSWVWPGEALARNIAPPSQLVLGLKRLGIDRSHTQNLGRPDGVALARFMSIHLVRPVVEDDPTLIVRSGPDLPRYAVDQRELASMSDRLMEHLYNRFTSIGLVRGTYHPTSGRYDPPIAKDDQAALLCYAITHHSRYLTVARPFDNSPILYAQRAAEASVLLGGQALRDDTKADPRVVALLLMTQLEAPAEVADQDQRDRLGGLLIKLTAPMVAPDADDSKLKDGTSALAAAALSLLFERTRQPQAGEVARALVDQLWARPGKTPNLSALPWLVMAHERAGVLWDEVDSDEAYKLEQARRARVLALVIDRICEFQVIEKPVFGPDDVLGGFVLTPGPAGSPPNPDWRNAQPLLLLSMVLRDESITAGQDKLGWLISTSYSARFVGQLMMDDASCYYVRDRVSARGGVRMAPWDNRLALAPSAMSLLALTELQTTLLSFQPDHPQVDDDTPGLESLEPVDDPQPVNP